MPAKKTTLVVVADAIKAVAAEVGLTASAPEPSKSRTACKAARKKLIAHVEKVKTAVRRERVAVLGPAATVFPR